MRGPDGGPSAGSLTELAALEAARDEKRRLLDRAAEAAVAELGRKGPAARRLHGRRPPRPPAALLLERAGRRGPRPRARGARRPRDRAPAPRRGAAARLGDRRRAAAPGRPGASIRLVTDDMPYLVDSVTAEVVRQGVTLAHIVHRSSSSGATSRGRIMAFCDSSLAVGCGSDALTESWMAVVLDGPLDDEAAADLVDRPAHRARRRPGGGRGRRAAAGPGAGARRPAGRARRLRRAVPDADPADDPAEAAALLRWLADGNFVFLGARDVDLVPARGKRRRPRRPRLRPGRAAQRHRHERRPSSACPRPPGRRRSTWSPSPRPTPARPCTAGPGST